MEFTISGHSVRREDYDMATYKERFQHICNEFNVGFRDGEGKPLIMNRWDDIAQNICDGHFTLLIGAGVTGSIVGQWNDLLNEVAIYRVLSDNESMKLLTVNKLRTFIAASEGMRGRFLPAETDALEKGEYLKQDSGDCVGSGSTSTAKEEVTREVAFAHRVLTAIETLTKINLRGKDYIEDFLAWKENRDNIIEGFPKLKRKEIVYTFAGEDADAISSEGKKRLPLAAILNNDTEYSLQELTSGFYEWLGNYEIYFTHKQKKNFASILAKMLLPLGKSYFDKAAGPKDTEKTVTEDLMHLKAVKLADDLKKYVEKKGSIDEKSREDLCKMIAEAIWLPDYGTLDALLELCLKETFSRVLTYNFDTIFDHLLANDDVQKAYNVTRPVEVMVYGIHDTDALNLQGFCTKSVSDNPVIKIYHVHGVLDECMCNSREDEIDGSVEKKSKAPLIAPIIFSGSSYSSYQSNHFNLGSLRIADAVNEGCLLCVGFSGVDANFRSIQSELIRSRNQVLSLQDYKRHDVYITRSLKQDRKCFDMVENGKDIDTAYACLRSHMNMMQDYFDNVVGANLIWAENFEAMAALLRELKK